MDIWRDSLQDALIEKETQGDFNLGDYLINDSYNKLRLVTQLSHYAGY